MGVFLRNLLCFPHTRTHTVWTIPTPQCLSLEHPRTCPTEPYGLALTLQLCTCTCAIPAQICSASSGLVAFWFTVMCPHCLPRPGPSTWPWAAICKHFGLLTVFLHTWEAPATSQAFLASVNPEEDQPPSFPEGRMTPFSILSAKQKESTTACFLSEGLSGSSQNGLRVHRGTGCPREGINRLLQQDQKGGDQ